MHNQTDFEDYKKELQSSFLNDLKDIEYNFYFEDVNSGRFRINQLKFNKISNGRFLLTLNEKGCEFELTAIDFRMDSERGYLNKISGSFYNQLQKLKADIHSFAVATT